jgi:eukaryotic-like serine/threonine-protein kinase
VTLFVSSGKPEKPVPNVVGLDQATASAELTGAGFSVAPATVTSTTVAAGNVISQSPSGGTDATPGSTVTITIAKAPPPVNVPPVVGDSPSSAQSALRAAGFQVSRQTQDVTDQSQNGIVISQSPRSGSTVKPGSTVTIVIGKFVPSNTTTSTTTTPTSTSTSTTSTTTTSTSTNG